MVTSGQARVVRIFLSSPSDMQAERRSAATVIDELDQSSQFQEHVKLLAYTYEDRVPPRAALPPQRTVDTYMLRPDEADIMVCFLWQKMGTPTADLIDPETKLPYRSGTEYEFLSAYRASKVHHRPIVLLYRCMRSVPPGTTVDPAQSIAVEKFFARFGSTGDLHALKHTFDDEASWRAILTRDLIQVLRHDFISSEPAPITPQSRLPVFFLPDNLPPEYVPRPAALDRLRKTLLGSQSQVGVVAAAAVHGQGGLGKTVLARAICNDEMVRSVFRDGILWATLGQQPDMLSLQQRWIHLLGGDVGAAGTHTEAKAELQRLLSDRKMLLVLDDAWQASDAQILQVGGPGCRQLITTRNVATVGGAALVPLEVLHVEESRALLRQASGGLVSDVALADEIAKRLGHLPLALRLVGAQLEVGVPWSALRDALESHDLRYIGMEQAEVLSAIASSVEALSSEEQLRYHELAIFPQAEPLDPQVVARLWGTTSGLHGFKTELLLGKMRARALIQADNRLHDLQFDYLQYEVDEPTRQRLHAQLADAYGDRATWPYLPATEGYAWRRLAWHLAQAERNDDLNWLVTHGMYLQGKISLLGTAAAIGDLLLLPEHDDNVQPLVGTLRLSAPALRRAPSELANQVYGRLGAFSALHDLPAPSRRPAFQLLSMTLIPPGRVLYATLEGHLNAVRGCAMSADGRLAVSASDDRTLRVWDVASGETVHILTGHSGRVRGCAMSADGRLAVSASDDRTLRVWDVASGESLQVFTGHSSPANACAISTDGRWTISASLDHTLRLWDVASGESLQVFTGHTGPVNGCAMSADGRLAVSASDDRTLRVWDVASGDTIRELTGHSGRIRGCAMSADGRLVVSASNDRTLRVWDVASGDTIRELTGHLSAVRGCAMSADGRLAVSASDDRTLRVWDVASGDTIRVMVGHSDEVNGCAMSADGRLAVSASRDKAVRLWSIPTGKNQQHLVRRGHTRPVLGCALGQDEPLAVSASQDHTLRLWDVTSGDTIRVLVGHNYWVSACAMSADGRLVVSASRDRTLRVWDVASGDTIRQLIGHDDWVRDCAMSADGRLVVSASQDRTLRVWDVASGDTIHQLIGHSGEVRGCAMSADGRLAVSASQDRTLRVWDVASGDTIHQLIGHSGRVNSCAMSADGRLAVSASDDRTLRVWDVASGESLQVFTGHSSPVRDCAMSPDARFVISASRDETLRLWDVATGDELAECIFDTELTSCSWHPNKPLVVCGDLRNKVHFLAILLPTS